MIAIKFEAIRPPQFNSQFYRKNLVFEMGAFGREAVKEFSKVTKFFKSNRPKFSYNLNTIAEGRTRVEVSVSTDNPLFFWLDQGVPAHDIIPRKRFISGTSGTYHSASLPGTLSTDPAGGTKIIDGRYLNLNWVVPWSGIRAREWTRLIREKMESEYSLADRLQTALNKSAGECWKGE